MTFVNISNISFDMMQSSNSETTGSDYSPSLDAVHPADQRIGHLGNENESYIQAAIDDTGEDNDIDEQVVQSRDFSELSVPAKGACSRVDFNRVYGECAGARDEEEGVPRMMSSRSDKYLTARYPKQKLDMVRRRLAIDDWIDTSLKELYDDVQDVEVRLVYIITMCIF